MNYTQSENLYRQGMAQLSALPEITALEGRRVCVVGCTGLIGSVLTAALTGANQGKKRPIEVIGVARRACPAELRDAPGFTFAPGSVTDEAFVASLPPCDYTIYIAGTASDYLSRPAETVETQTVGVQRFLAVAKESRGFVYVSSARVYGRATGEGPITEDLAATVSPMHTDNIYDSAKRLGESLCLWHASTQDTRAIVARLTNVYGLSPTLRSETAVSDFVRQAVEKCRIELKGHPDTVRNYCCTLDIAQGLLKALVNGQSGRAYNIGAREHYTMRNLAQTIAAALPFPVEVAWRGSVAIPSVQRISIERACAELGYAPRHTFAQFAPLIVRQTAHAPKEGVGCRVSGIGEERSQIAAALR